MNKILAQKMRAAAEQIQQQSHTHGAAASGVALNAGDRELVNTIKQGLQAWKNSAAGQAFLKDAKQMAPEAIARGLQSLLESEHLAPSMQMLNEQAQLDLSFPIQSVSIGLVGQFDVILAGLVLSVGYAADITNVSSTSVIYLGGGVTAGLELGLDGGIEVGVWRNKTSDMQGNYKAEEIEFVDDGGIIITGYEQDDKVQGVTVSLDVGANDGVSVEDYYIFTFDIDHYPVYQEGDASHLLVLTTLTCLNSNIGTDDVYLTFRPDGGTTYRYPTWGSYGMTQDSGDVGHSWGLGRSVKFNSYVDVQLQVGADDFPSIRFNYSDFHGIGSTSTKTADRDGSIGNGWNEIKYQLGAILMK